MFVRGNLVSWKSKKQNVVSRSRAMTQSICEIMWLHQILEEVGIKTSVPAKLWCDNQAALNIASNPIFHATRFDFYRIYVKIEEQLGDNFTKALSGDRVSYLCNKLDMINIYAPT